MHRVHNFKCKFFWMFQWFLHPEFIITSFVSLMSALLWCFKYDVFSRCTNLCGSHLSIKGKVSLFAVSLLSQTDRNHSERQARKTRRIHLLSPWKCTTHLITDYFLTTNGTNGNALVVSVIYTISDNTTGKVSRRRTQIKIKANEKLASKTDSEEVETFGQSLWHLDVI